MIEKRHEPAAAKAPGTDNGTDHGPGNALRKALVEANGGSTKLDIKALRDGSCSKVFAIVEELVNVISEEGLKGDEFFMNMVEDRNLALGDTRIIK